MPLNHIKEIKANETYTFHSDATIEQNIGENAKVDVCGGKLTVCGSVKKNAKISTKPPQICYGFYAGYTGPNISTITVLGDLEEGVKIDSSGDIIVLGKIDDNCQLESHHTLFCHPKKLSRFATFSAESCKSLSKEDSDNLQSEAKDSPAIIPAKFFNVIGKEKKSALPSSKEEKSLSHEQPKLKSM